MNDKKFYFKGSPQALKDTVDDLRLGVSRVSSFINYAPDLCNRTCTCVQKSQMNRAEFLKIYKLLLLKTLMVGMGEVVPARTLPTLHPPSPPTVHQLS